MLWICHRTMPRRCRLFRTGLSLHYYSVLSDRKGDPGFPRPHSLPANACQRLLATGARHRMGSLPLTRGVSGASADAFNPQLGTTAYIASHQSTHDSGTELQLRNCFPAFMRHRSSAPQVRSPAQKALTASRHLDLMAGRSPSTMLQGTSASNPQFRHLLPASRSDRKLAALAKVFLGQRCNCLPKSGVRRFKR